MPPMLFKLGPLAADWPGCISYARIPSYVQAVRGVYLIGRRPRDIERVSLRVNGCEVMNFEPTVTEDGVRLSGGEMARLLSAYLGPVQPVGIPLEFSDAPLRLAERDHAELMVWIDGRAGPGVLSVFVVVSEC